MEGGWEGYMDEWRQGEREGELIIVFIIGDLFMVNNTTRL